MFGMGSYKFGECIGRTTVGQGAAGSGIRTSTFCPAQQFHGFAHEIHSAHNHNVGILSGIGSLPCQSEAVAYIIGNILNIAINIIMS